MEESGTDSRKRRRITPILSTTAPPIGITEARSVAPARTHNTDVPAETGTWDFLAKWEEADNTILGDVEEDEYLSDMSDESLSALEVAEHESEDGDGFAPEGPAMRVSKLGTEKVIDIINDCIETYTKAWVPGKGETKHKNETGQAEIPVTYDAVVLWEEAEAAAKREEFAEKHELEAEYYRQRLDQLCEEILKNPGDTVAGVQMACRNLEVTVELLERAAWLEGIYKLPPDDIDDEAQDEDSTPTDKSQPQLARPTTCSQQQVPVSQIFDLGAPSDSENSEYDSAPLGDIHTRPQINSGSKQERAISSEKVALNGGSKQERIPATQVVGSEPTIVVSVEKADPASIATLTATSPLTVRSRPPLGDAPENASIFTVSRWSWAHLEDTQDRKRVVSKAICELSSADKEVIRQRLQKVGRASMVREIPACVDMLLRGDTKMPGILPQDLPKIINFTRLFFCWWLCGNYLAKTPSEVDLAELRDCLRDSSTDPTTFCDYVGTVLNTTFSPAALHRSTQPSQNEIIIISDDDDEPPPRPPRRRKSDTNKPGSQGEVISID